MMPILMSPFLFAQSRENDGAQNNLKYGRLMQSDGMDQPYCDLPDMTKFVRTQMSLHTLSIQKQSLQSASLREQFVTQQIKDAQTLNENLNLMLRSANTPHHYFVDIKKQAHNTLQELTGILNRAWNHNPTLSGIGQNAVKNLTDLDPLSVTQSFDADNRYYVGGESSSLVILDNHIQISTNSLTAKHPAFEKLIRSCRLLLSENLSLEEGKRALELSEEVRTQDFPNAIYLSSAQKQKIDNDLRKLPDRENLLAQDLKIYGLEATLTFLEKYENERLSMEISQSLTQQMLKDLQRMIERGA